MIREVHVYGKVAELQSAEAGEDLPGSGKGIGRSVQHLGLGRQLIQIACERAKARGYLKLNVISSVGTREYYRNLGFADTALYQQLTF